MDSKQKIAEGIAAYGREHGSTVELFTYATDRMDLLEKCIVGAEDDEPTTDAVWYAELVADAMHMLIEGLTSEEEYQALCIRKGWRPLP